MKRILVNGAGGFIGGHLVKKLKERGNWVRGVDLKHDDFKEFVGMSSLPVICAIKK